MVVDGGPEAWFPGAGLGFAGGRDGIAVGDVWMGWCWRKRSLLRFRRSQPRCEVPRELLIQITLLLYVRNASSLPTWTTSSNGKTANIHRQSTNVETCHRGPSGHVNPSRLALPSLPQKRLRVRETIAGQQSIPLI